MQFLERVQKLMSRMSGNEFEQLVLQIDGSDLVSGTYGTVALDIGARYATAKDDGSNTVTVSFNEKLPAAPIVQSFVSNTADGKLDTYTSTTSTFTYVTVKASDNTALADVDATITLLIPRQKI